MILRGTELYSEPVACKGLLIIGDPQVSSRRPGRRTDDDWPGPILRKLEKCAEISRERELATIMLGDVFDTALEPDEGLKTRVSRIFKSFFMVPLTNVGNHDIRNTELSDGDSLAYLATSDVVDAVATTGPVCEFALAGKRVGIGMTPYGQEIPTTVTGMFPKADAVIWFTHHDIAFEKSYPGAMAPHPIEGCGMVVNGHMHDTKTPVKKGNTLWTNPGNINRMTVDLIDHVPCAWILHGDGRLEAVSLPHEKAVFDLTGKLVDAADTGDLVRDIESSFVNLLQAESTTDMQASADGSLIEEEIVKKFDRDSTPDAVRLIVKGLHAEAVRRRNAA